MFICYVFYIYNDCKPRIIELMYALGDIGKLYSLQCCYHRLKIIKKVFEGIGKRLHETFIKYIVLINILFVII